MFDMIWGNSYVVLRYGGTLYLEESYDTLVKMINDSNSTITVHVLDFLTGIFTDVKTISKSEITSYGQN